VRAETSQVVRVVLEYLGLWQGGEGTGGLVSEEHRPSWTIGSTIRPQLLEPNMDRSTLTWSGTRQAPPWLRYCFFPFISEEKLRMGVRKHAFVIGILW
jgi:hypothetical protein